MPISGAGGGTPKITARRDGARRRPCRTAGSVRDFAGGHIVARPHRAHWAR
ncbi:hypothetical protein OG225_09245 [Nocardia sp. NBC_01377]|uniref:hypothetical protein n=1 Tax=Nocardia sp. NBC_01377 TaxID=2903595 RepID=UPI0032465BE9